jgi:hypothetical protein
MMNTVDFNDRPNRRHGQTEDLVHLGPQTRDARINTTPFIWWNLVSKSGDQKMTVTCCLRCDRSPFLAPNSFTATKNDFYKWIISHENKGCFDSIDEYRKATKTTIQDITAGRISRTIAADIRKTDIRLGFKQKRIRKAPSVSETPARISEAINTVSEGTVPIPETETESISKETIQALRDHSGPVEEGDTAPTLDDIVEMVLYDVRNYKKTIAKLKDESESAKAIATLRAQVAALQKEQEELKERLRDDLAELDEFRRKQEYGKM